GAPGEAFSATIGASSVSRRMLSEKNVRIQSVVVLLVGLLVSAGCASQQCDFHSQCGDKHYCARGRCWQDCQMDFDCDDGLVCNAIGRCLVPSGQHDAGPMDAGMMMPPVPDAGPMPMPDSG